MWVWGSPSEASAAMTDIVERLRCPWCKTAGCDLLRYEAADEIERLKEQIDALRKAPDIKTGRANERTEVWRKHAMNCEADIRRLRERVTEAENRQGLAEIEIERLKQALAKAEAYMDQFAAEANRLREALQNALEYGVTSRNIASIQAALSQKEGE